MVNPPPMDGVYNASDENEAEGYTHYQTVPVLPSIPLFHSECTNIAKLLKATIDHYLMLHRIPKWNSVISETFGEYSIGEYPTDRTMCFFIDELAAFKPELVRILQERVLAKFPLWRLLAQYNEYTFGIYPQGVWLNRDRLILGEFDETHPDFLEWLTAATDFREKKYGPLSRQLAFLVPRIPNAVRYAELQKYVQLAAFDSSDGFTNGHSIWILSQGSLEGLILGEYNTDAKYKVGKDGKVYPEFDRSTFGNNDPPYLLNRFIVQAAQNHHYPLKTAQDEESVGSITFESIVSDSSLKD